MYLYNNTVSIFVFDYSGIYSLEFNSNSFCKLKINYITSSNLELARNIRNLCSYINPKLTNIVNINTLLNFNKELDKELINYFKFKKKNNNNININTSSSLINYSLSHNNINTNKLYNRSRLYIAIIYIHSICIKIKDFYKIYEDIFIESILFSTGNTSDNINESMNYIKDEEITNLINSNNLKINKCDLPFININNLCSIGYELISNYNCKVHLICINIQTFKNSNNCINILLYNTLVESTNSKLYIYNIDAFSNNSNQDCNSQSINYNLEKMHYDLKNILSMDIKDNVSSCSYNNHRELSKYYNVNLKIICNKNLEISKTNKTIDFFNNKNNSNKVNKHCTMYKEISKSLNICSCNLNLQYNLYLKSTFKSSDLEVFFIQIVVKHTVYLLDKNEYSTIIRDDRIRILNYCISHSNSFEDIYSCIDNDCLFKLNVLNSLQSLKYNFNQNNLETLHCNIKKSIFNLLLQYKSKVRYTLFIINYIKSIIVLFLILL